MSALSASRVTPEYAPRSVIRSYKMKASTQIWEGGIVAVGSDGYAVPGATSTTQIAVGVAQSSKLSSAVDGADSITVHEGVFRMAADSAFAQTGIGGACYIVDDQTVSLTGTSRSLAGIVAAIEGSNVWVEIALNPPNEDAALTSFESSLASTANAAGASLVGIEDSAGIITATTAEAAFAELAKDTIGFGKAPQALSGAGACNVTALVTLFTSTGGAQALTLANGTYTGQLKVVHHTVDGGSGVLTPATAGNFATFTLTNIHDACLLQWSGTAWNILLNVGGTVG